MGANQPDEISVFLNPGDDGKEETESQCKTAESLLQQKMGNLFFLFLFTPYPQVAYAGSADYELDQITDQAENWYSQLGKKPSAC